MLRAYDKRTGQELAALRLPAPQSGSPMTYMLNGRQFLVIAVSANDHPGELVAYALPQEPAPVRSGAAE
jgi:quinoprotein glucose dehydrogenase